MKKMRIFVILLLLLSIFLYACGNNANDNNEQGEDKDITTTETEDTTVTEIKESETKQDRIVRVNASFPLRTDPAIGSNSIESSIFFNIYDALVFSEVDGTIVPHVAESWDIADDGLLYTFYLRDDVKFHDGSLLKAKDVEFSMNRMLAIGQGFSYLWQGFVDKAVAIDDTTVEIHLLKSFGPLISTLVRMPILNEELVMANKSEGSYGEHGDYGSEYLLTNDAGSGPFMMTEMKTNESMSAVRFNDYWKEWNDNNPDGFKVMAVNDTATIRTMMANKELDITDEWQSVESLDAMGAMDGVSVARINSGANISLEINTKKAPTDDEHFRKALAYLFDYDTATTTIFPNTEQAVGPVVSSYEGYDPEGYQYFFSLEKAKEELSLSKYASDYGDYPVTIDWSASVPDQEKLCLLLNQACDEVGIDLVIQKTPYATMTANAASVDTTANITIMYPSGAFSEAGSVLYRRYHSSTTGSHQQFEWLQNAEIDAALEDAQAELDYEKRMQMYKDLQAEIIDICPTIWVLENPESRAYQEGSIYWPEAVAEKNAALIGRALYFRTIEYN